MLFFFQGEISSIKHHWTLAAQLEMHWCAICFMQRGHLLSDAAQVAHTQESIAMRRDCKTTGGGFGAEPLQTFNWMQSRKLMDVKTFLAKRCQKHPKALFSSHGGLI